MTPPAAAVPAVVLASRSPRRQQLLAALGVPFQVDAADVDETPQAGEAPEAVALRLAQAKALAVAARHPGRVVLASDTVVALEDAVLGKPADAAEAVAMLLSLRGRPHRVLSAVYALNAATGQRASALNVSHVWMRRYSDAEIAAYVASGDPMDKAGAYAIQSRSFAPVERVQGCFAGVMGFPLADVARVLAAVGVVPPADIAAACRPFSGRCCQESPAEGGAVNRSPSKAHR
ncbi:MAG: Maf family protein [Anaerolineae bacterium]|nr:Maf family protein [Anaerolineae bacterium]